MNTETVKVLRFDPIATGVSQSSRKEWKKLSFVGETIGQYPRKIAFVAFNGKVDELMGNAMEGDVIDVSFEPESREYNGRYYTDLRVLRVAPHVFPAANAPQNPTNAPQYPAAPQQHTAMAAQAQETNGGNNDDLPF